jgi:hypothetical protein
MYKPITSWVFDKYTTHWVFVFLFKEHIFKKNTNNLKGCG